ncbi:MAG: inositol monophosphatase [Hyphomicrobiales bacterium]|nr:MAG: inositol monophosphatase [Hyphomicrobiales bacterium]
MARSALLNVMVQAAQKAARGLMRDLGEVENLQVSLKGPGDFVSAADRRAEKVIYEELERARPGYSFLMEESGVIDRNSEHRWIIDPMDGTTNFLHSIPLFAVSLALETHGELMASVIYNPISEELFTAERGKGAFLNDRRMRVSARKDLSQSLIATGIPALNRDKHSEYLYRQSLLMTRTAGVRATGSAALNLAWLALGRFDGYMETGLSPWDIAGGMLMVREAGGFVSEPDPKASIYETGRLIAGNDVIHGKLRELANLPYPSTK